MNTRPPLSFGKTFLASGLGVIAAFALFGLLGMLMLVAASAAIVKADNSSIVAKKFYLQIDLGKRLCEQTPDTWVSYLSDQELLSLEDILNALDHAAADSRVQGLVILGDNATLSWAQAEEIRNAVAKYQQATGNKVYAYAEAYSTPAYYLVSQADSILLHPSGLVDLRGICAQSLHYKDLLDRYDIHVDLIRPRSNAYKSAGETYIRRDMSPDNKAQTRAYIASIWNHAVAQIAQSRGTAPDSINRWADNLEAYMADGATQHRMVDALAFRQNLTQCLNGVKTIGVSRYATSLQKSASANHIAVIYAEGNVISGKNKGFETNIYSQDMVKALNDAAADKNVKAIVLRVNSPGGAVTASEDITHAVIQARESKPLVVSMGALAASAGYEISCNAHVIVAQPTTLTGSIGVFATVPEVGTLLSRHLGITTDTVMTNRNASGLSLLRPLSPTARAMMQKNVEDFYVTFCSRVAKGRGLQPQYVDEIGRGRVWTGTEAIKIGLVDTLGGIDLALDLAAQMADIADSYSIVTYPKNKGLVELLSQWSSTNEEQKIRARLRAVIPFYDALEYWSHAAPLQARMEEDLAF